MDAPPPTFDPAIYDAPLRRQFDAFLDDHRQILLDCLDGLTEEQARRRLVPSRTTLLGLVKHATFVEKVWFVEAVTGRSRAELGLPATPDESFVLGDTDTIASIQAAHRAACDDSRRAVADLCLDAAVPHSDFGAMMACCGPDGRTLAEIAVADD